MLPAPQRSSISGPGIGALTFELLEAGVPHATAVDASSAFLAGGARRGRTAPCRASHRMAARRLRCGGGQICPRPTSWRSIVSCAAIPRLRSCSLRQRRTRAVASQSRIRWNTGTFAASSLSRTPCAGSQVIAFERVRALGQQDGGDRSSRRIPISRVGAEAGSGAQMSTSETRWSRKSLIAHGLLHSRTHPCCRALRTLSESRVPRMCRARHTANPLPDRASSKGRFWDTSIGRSATVAGWPLIHVCAGVDPATMRPQSGEGVIADRQRRRRWHCNRRVSVWARLGRRSLTRAAVGPGRCGAWTWTLAWRTRCRIRGGGRRRHRTRLRRRRWCVRPCRHRRGALRS